LEANPQLPSYRDITWDIKQQAPKPSAPPFTTVLQIFSDAMSEEQSTTSVQVGA
jgi:hypothetical protein